MPSSRIVACDQDITRINSTAPESEGIRLRKVEAAARGFDLGQGDVSVLENCRLPHLLVGQHGAITMRGRYRRSRSRWRFCRPSRGTESLIQTKTNFMRWCTTKMPATSSCAAGLMRHRWSRRRHRCNGRCGNRFSIGDGKQHDVMVAGHQERERRRERLNSEAAERAHEAATRRRKVENR